jgi:hypothetical protein
MREKGWSTPRVTIHQHPEIYHLGMQFVQNWSRKRSYTISRNCRGSRDLQLSFLPLGSLQFNILEKIPVKVGRLNWCWLLALQSGARTGVHTSAAPRPHWACMPMSASVRRSARRGNPLAQHRILPRLPTPRIARVVATSRQSCHCPPSRVAAVPGRPRRRTPCSCHGLDSRTALQATATYKRQESPHLV